jgi:polysaccharide export outer membrane protein
MLFLSGCEVNDFINPGEPKILGKDAPPLQVPILDTLASGIEEPNSAYSNATEIRPDDLVPIIADYQIGKSDLVSVSIYDLLGEGTGETVKNVRVSESGNISLPYISPVKAENLTERQLEDVIKKSYADAKLIREARVAVTVVEARARTFSVTGNTSAPGEYQITRPDYRMLDAMVASRTPTIAIGVKYAYVIRKLTPATQPTDTTSTPAPDEHTVPTTAPGDLLAPPGAAPATTPPATPTMPPGPTGRANSSGHVVTAAMMMDDTTGSNPTTMPAGSLLAPGATDQPTGMIEGKPAPAPGANAQALPPMPMPTTSEPAGFQFNDLQAPTDIRVIRVPINDLRQNGELKYNIVIRPGDLIIVPDPVAGVYYVGGHVLSSGAFSLSGQDITLKQAFIAAHGADADAIPRRTEVIRRVGDNKEVFVRVNLSRILAGEQPDFYLKPNDTMVVGTDFLAPFISAVRGSFRVSSGFGFLYDRNFYSGPNGF